MVYRFDGTLGYEKWTENQSVSTAVTCINVSYAGRVYVSMDGCARIAKHAEKTADANTVRFFMAVFNVKERAFVSIGIIVGLAKSVTLPELIGSTNKTQVGQDGLLNFLLRNIKRSSVCLVPIVAFIKAKTV